MVDATLGAIYTLLCIFQIAEISLIVVHVLHACSTSVNVLFLQLRVRLELEIHLLISHTKCR